MKILHFGKFYPPFNGGMEIYLRDLAEQQAKTNSVTVLVHNHKFNTLVSPMIAETINQVDVIRQKTLKPVLFTPIMLGTNKIVTQLVSQDKADIIHISWPNPSALFLLLNKAAKTKPWVIQWQSDMVTENSSWLLKLAYKLFKPFETKLLQQASKIIVSTEEYYNHSIALKKFQPKCEVIPLGIKPQTYKIDDTDKQWAVAKWNNAKYKIYTIGRLTFYKNHQLLLQAAELLPNAKFIITGTGDLAATLTKLIDQKSLNNIILTGSLRKNKLNALLSTCDAFCLPSNDRAESYGMVLLEALNFNKTILVSNLAGSGMRWIASQTKLGQTFDCNDASDLVTKIKGSLHTESKVDYKPFSIEFCAKTIDSLYRDLVK